MLMAWGSLYEITAQKSILDKQKMLDKFSFWGNQDWEWYKENIPFLETPDTEIDKIYYYRWEVVTMHLVYGSPESGYATTEFINRPWWSGAFGTISCPAGHQLYDWRWLRNQQFFKDYARFWFKTPGAQTQNYTNWITDAVWEGYKVNGDFTFTTNLLNDLKTDYYTWEKKFWVEEEGMFAWDGMHDGMETNINSRQTPQWFNGAPGYRPTFNAYMWAAANAITHIAEIIHDDETVREFKEKAATIKTNLQAKCWDPKRKFFFHRFQNNELTADKNDTIKANTLTYEDGPFAGNEHGRELMAYVPWYFNMIDDKKEFGQAWQFLMDPNYFYAEYGPTTVERHDPLFKISDKCCVWSGNSWPFATTQTIKAMSNALNNYKNVESISKKDFYKMMKVFAHTHQKNGKPYIAEDLHPFTGSWEGHDMKGHSEHYYHSSYVDLVIADLIGIKPQANDSIVIRPLTPKEWDYFILEDVPYHGHNISVVWDKTGKKYGQGKGFKLLLDGKIIAASETVTELKAHIPKTEITKESPRKVNYAVNNSKSYYPRAIASFPGVGNPVAKMNDGQFWYFDRYPNQWSTAYSENKQDWAGIDFGTERPIEKVVVYFAEDEKGLKAPESYLLQYWDGHAWKEIRGQERQYAKPMARRGNTIRFPEVSTSKIRLLLTEKDENEVGISEIETWGKPNFPIHIPSKPIDGTGFEGAMVSASYTSEHDNVNNIIDGKIDMGERWSAYKSPNRLDWVRFDFPKQREISKAYIYFYDEKESRYLETDNYNIVPPKKLTVQYWNGSSWKNAKKQNTKPETLLGNAMNIVTFKRINTNKIRVVMEHVPQKYSGIYEIEFLK